VYSGEGALSALSPLVVNLGWWELLAAKVVNGASAWYDDNDLPLAELFAA
jgi:hypothetical protein